MSVVTSTRLFTTSRVSRVAVACALGLISVVADADSNGRVSVAGFGTMGAVYHNEAGIEYRRDPSQGRGAQRGEIDLSTDSRLGIQINAALSGQVEGMVQVETKLDAHNHWNPQINWAVLKYSPTQWLTLSAGRLNFDPFVGGNTRDIGYSWLTARPPIEVFGSMNSQRYDGVEALIGSDLGSGLVELKLYGGEMAGGQTVLAPSYIVEADGSELIGGHLEYSTGLWSIRLGASEGSLGTRNPAEHLIAASRAIGTAQSINLANALNVQGRTITELTVSSFYRPGPLHVEAIASRARSKRAALPLGDRAMAIIGYRFGEFTPYIAGSVATTERNLYTTGVPSSASSAASDLNIAVERIQRDAWANQRSWVLGVRYDPFERLALKAQVDIVDVDDASVLLETDANPGGQRTFGVFSLAVDFLF